MKQSLFASTAIIAVLGLSACGGGGKGGPGGTPGEDIRIDDGLVSGGSDISNGDGNGNDSSGKSFH